MSAMMIMAAIVNSSVMVMSSMVAGRARWHIGARYGLSVRPRA